jgi:hypothetical protein
VEDELLLDWRKPIHISFISVYSEINKLTGFVNCLFGNVFFFVGHRVMAAF